jgi:GNAT superfamily N-acetyltransferase
MIKIDYLKHHPQHIPPLAKIWLDTIGKMWAPQVSLEETCKRFQTHLNSDTLPLTFVALDHTIPVGMCSLRLTDGLRPDLSPWLGSLVVDPKYQNHGIGKLLINATQDKARQLGFEKLHLFTFDPTLPNYYSQLGWNIIEMNELHGHPITVMDLKL